MKPIDFPQANAVFGKDQAEYVPLPCHLATDQFGTLISCWQLSAEEAAKVAETGVVWLAQLTFGQRLQPQLVSADSPFADAP